MRFSRRTTFPVFSPILSHRDFTLLLRKAEERSLRTGTRYALVLFSFGEERKRRRLATKRIIRHVFGRIRTTDDIGWYDDHRIGILLPGAARNGVQLLIEDIRNRLGPRVDGLEVTVSGLGKREPANGDGGSDLPDTLHEA